MQTVLKQRIHLFIYLCFIVGPLMGCATLQLEQPQVSITGISPLKTRNLEALLELHIRISNPNGVPLPLKGMSYELSINDTGVLRGVSSRLATIPAYGSEDFTIELSTSLFAAPKVLLGLLNNPKQNIRYAFTTKIDLQGVLPSFRLTEQGVLPTARQ